MKNKLSDEAVNAVTNELKGGSVFFQREHPSEEPKPIPKNPNPPDTTGYQDEAAAPVRDVRPVRTERREIKRHPFDFYRDQLQALQALKVAFMQAGEEKSMSAMVREALDAYLKQHR